MVCGYQQKLVCMDGCTTLAKCSSGHEVVGWNGERTGAKSLRIVERVGLASGMWSRVAPKGRKHSKNEQIRKLQRSNVWCIS